MFERDWFSYVALGLIIGIGSTLVFVTWMELNCGPVCQGYLYGRTLENNQDYEGTIITRPDSGQVVQHPIAPNNPTDPNYYDYYNLRAQQSMAQSTAVLVQWTFASIFLGVVGAVAIVWTLVATREAVRAADDANKSLANDMALRNPPLIAVMMVSVKLVPDAEIVGSCFIVNEGTSEAFIDDPDDNFCNAELTLLFTSGILPQIHHLENPKTHRSRYVGTGPKRKSIASGQARKWEYTGGPDFRLSVEDIAKINNPRSKWKLYVMGRIRYRSVHDGKTIDQAGRTIFCRCFNPKTERYEPVEDPYYEYRHHGPSG